MAEYVSGTGPQNKGLVRGLRLWSLGFREIKEGFRGLGFRGVLGNSKIRVYVLWGLGFRVW